MSNDASLVVLLGNPNVGKSTVFNQLTGLNQHTGNWPGKTVDLFQGLVVYKNRKFRFVDLPGTYSLRPNSKEEEIARNFLFEEKPDVTVCVADATSLERNLALVLQVLRISTKCVLCLNFMDEALARGIIVDVPTLEKGLGIPVVATAARTKMGLEDLMGAIDEVVRLRGAETFDDIKKPLTDEEVEGLFARAEKIVGKAVKVRKKDGKELSQKIDDIVMSRFFGIPIMVFLLCTIFSVSLYFANYPSEILGKVLFAAERPMVKVFEMFGGPTFFSGFFIRGVYRTVAWVTAVMLPPMAIFFPLWTFLEDLGYLPRAAFNLDHLFQKAGGHGKQALTMAMGLGCNAAGVVACRIIESPRERLVAMMTNTFVPCNGRFPMLIALSAIFFTCQGFLGAILPGAVVAGLVVFGVCATLAVSKILSTTILKGIQSSFVLELPPYRKPDFLKVIVRSWKDRTVWVLRRALLVAAPCGALTWLMANVRLGQATLLLKFTTFMNPLAALFGMDGVILTAFVLGFPANEIVLPVALMGYLAQSSMFDIGSIDAIGCILRANGWEWTTALSVLLFSLLHYPCGTTVYTVYKETGSAKWAFMSIFIPTATGLTVLFVLNVFFRLVGL